MNEIHGRYEKIPDHSDLRGFSYRAPTHYDWSDDHGSPRSYPTKDGRFHSAAPERSPSLWSSVKNFLGKGPKGYRRSDERIREDVCEALMRHPGIDASEIEVEVTDSVVTLKGSVPDRWMKRASEWVIDPISGVTDVRNHLELS